MKHCFLFLALVTLLTACNTKQSNSNKVTYLTKEDLPPLQQLEYEKIDLPEEECWGYLSYHVYHDSLLIIKHNMPKLHFLTAINLNTKEIIGRFITKGNGPGEVNYLSTQNLRKNLLYSYDPNSYSFIVFNMDSLWLHKQAYKPQIIRLSKQITTPYPNFDLLSDTSIVYYNEWYLENCENPANANAPELLKFGLDGKITYEIPDDVWNVSALNSSSLATDLERKRIFIAYNQKPEFKLLNLNFDTIQIIKGTDPFEKPVYKLFGVKGIPQIMMPDFYSFYGQIVLSTENYVFISMSKIRNIARLELEKANRTYELYKFDWDGNLLARYQFDQNSVAGYSESSNTLYVKIENEDGEFDLFKAKL